MRRFTRLFLIIGAALLFTFAITAFAQSAIFQSAQKNNIASAAMMAQTTPTPEQEDLSEVGSTDGIVIMGGVIALIVFIPILARYKDWTRPASQ